MTAPFKPFGTAREALTYLDNLVADSGVELTERVAVARGEIARIADDERDLLAGISAVVDIDPADAAEQAAARYLAREITAPEALAEMATAERSSARDRQKLSNKIIFRSARQASVELRRLGDDLITDVLAPWAARVVAELRNDAAVVADIGWAGVLDAQRWGAENEVDGSDLARLAEVAQVGGGRAARHAAVFAAQARVNKLHEIWKVADDLRARGFLKTMDDRTVSELAYRWAITTPDKLPDPAKDLREPWWTCAGLVNGAGPCVRTAAEAQATAPVAA
ncbi:hypothetical protein [Nocardia fluminea]|uniref:hypothetical protein n=1 Tax=Nocardia fluminea TaxID=134984 RepID=UPI0033FEF88D